MVKIVIIKPTKFSDKLFLFFNLLRELNLNVHGSPLQRGTVDVINVIHLRGRWFLMLFAAALSISLTICGGSGPGVGEKEGLNCRIG